MSDHRTAENFRDELNHYIASEERDLQKWIAKLTPDPLHAFEWAESAFTTAARISTAKRVLAWLDNASAHALEKHKDFIFADFLAAIAKELSEQVERGGRYPHRSTSAASNLANQEKVAACCWALDIIRRYQPT